MSTTLIKKNSTAADAVRLAQSTARAEQNSATVTMLLKKVPFQPTLSWFEKMFWLIDSLFDYRYDDEGREQIKTPDRFAEDGAGDCDDFSTLWMAILEKVDVLGFPKIVDYERDGYWDHIYVIVPLKPGGYITLDNVAGKFRRKFNVEVDSKEQKIFRRLK